MMKDPLRILLVSAEATPFAKTGGLADVASALARFLVGAGHDARLVMPLYSRVEKAGVELEDEPAFRDVPLELGPRSFRISASTAELPGSRARVWFIRCPELYARPEIYGSGGDEHLRFALLSRAAIALCQYGKWAPHVVHCNDWHTGLLPLYLKVRYAWDRLLERTRSVLTIHNIGYQGVFPAATLGELDLEGERHLLDQDDLKNGVVGFLKNGIHHADALTTVSETYAREIQTSELGMGLENALRARGSVLRGIVNGIDHDEWDPERDPRIPHRFSRTNLAGKERCKRDLLAKFDLEPTERSPLFGIVSRLTAQKGFDLLPDVLTVLLQRNDARLIVLGSGEERYESYFQWLRDTLPTKVAFWRGYNEDLAHWIEAGSDLFLMPSRYEPCGLNQMYSMRYGTVPVVRATGGLADTVKPFDRVSGEGTGFLFEEFSSQALFAAIRRALDVWADRPAWLRLVQSGMRQDFSWQRQGEHYVRLYRSLAGR